MEVRHNTTMLEQALALVVQRASIPTKQAEAKAAETLARAAARRRLATGGAIALAAVGVGLGIMFGLWKPLHETALPVAQTPDRLAPPNDLKAPIPLPEPAVLQAKPKSGIQHDLVVNYTKFTTKEMTYLGHGWTIEAGHHYAVDTDRMWNNAWCYTRQSINGVLVQIDLAVRDSPQARPNALIASPESLARVGLDDSAALELATRCPWLDGREYIPGDFNVLPGRNEKAATAPQIAIPDSSLPTTIPEPNPFANNGQTQYVAKDGFDLPGNDLQNMPISSESQLECETTCNSTNGCEAYVFNKTYKKCFLKTSTGTLFKNDTAYAGYKDNNGIPPRVSSLDFHKNTGFIGTFYKNVDTTRYVDCTLECDRDVNCRAFNFDSSTKQCTMLKSTNNAIPMPNVSSGAKALE